MNSATERFIQCFQSGSAQSWNDWRKRTQRRVRVTGVQLRNLDMDLSELHMCSVTFDQVELSGCVRLYIPNFKHSEFIHVSIDGFEFDGADLTDSRFRMSCLMNCKFVGSVRRTRFVRASLSTTKLNNVKFEHANLHQANVTRCELHRVDLKKAILSEAILVDNNFTESFLDGANVIGAAVWKNKFDDSTTQHQRALIIQNEPTPLTVDRIEVAQLFELIHDNDRLPDVFNELNKQAVLILGRFSHNRKPVLDAIRENLRGRNYLPIIFDFDRLESRDYTETVLMLASIVRFIIADITEPKSIPQELQAIVPIIAIPCVPIIEEGQSSYSMFTDYWKYPWLLPVLSYTKIDSKLPDETIDQIILKVESKHSEISKLKSVALHKAKGVEYVE